MTLHIFLKETEMLDIIIISYYYGWKCKINHPQAVHDVNLHVAGTCLFFCYQKVIAHA